MLFVRFHHLGYKFCFFLFPSKWTWAPKIRSDNHIKENIFHLSEGPAIHTPDSLKYNHNESLDYGPILSLSACSWSTTDYNCHHFQAGKPAKTGASHVFGHQEQELRPLDHSWPGWSGDHATTSTVSTWLTQSCTNLLTWSPSTLSTKAKNYLQVFEFCCEVLDSSLPSHHFHSPIGIKYNITAYN